MLFEQKVSMSSLQNVKLYMACLMGYNVIHTEFVWPYCVMVMEHCSAQSKCMCTVCLAHKI